MKRPKRKEETKIGKQYAMLKSLTGLDLDALAKKVTYTGNAKHKKSLGSVVFLGPIPKARFAPMNFMISNQTLQHG